MWTSAKISKTAAAALATFALTPAVQLVAAQDTQYWHEMYHGLLSMAAYGDYETTCPQYFTESTLRDSFPDSTEEPFTVLEKFGPTASGLEGFSVQIPEMDKIVVVFKGLYGWETMNHTSENINAEFNLGCENCTAHAGAVQAYREAKEATNSFAVAQQAATNTGHQFSITGHAFGGMVGLVAALDLGWKGISHWSHAHGTPRTFNQASAQLYQSLYSGTAGQIVVANNDPVPNFIPQSDDFVHPLSGFYIWGSNSTFGMNWRACNQEQEDPDCQGEANAPNDHYYYYAPVGECGQAPYYNQNDTLASSYVSGAKSEYYATATESIPSSFVEPAMSSPSSVVSSASASLSAATSAVSSVTEENSSAVDSAAASATTTDSSDAADVSGVYAAQATDNSNSGALANAVSGLASAGAALVAVAFAI